MAAHCLPVSVETAIEVYAADGTHRRCVRSALPPVKDLSSPSLCLPKGPLRKSVAESPLPWFPYLISSATIEYSTDAQFFLRCSREYADDWPIAQFVALLISLLSVVEIGLLFAHLFPHPPKLDSLTTAHSGYFSSPGFLVDSILGPPGVTVGLRCPRHSVPPLEHPLEIQSRHVCNVERFLPFLPKVCCDPDLPPGPCPATLLSLHSAVFHARWRDMTDR